MKIKEALLVKLMLDFVAATWSSTILTDGQ
jgi:hypothetical protein